MPVLQTLHEFHLSKVSITTMGGAFAMLTAAAERVVEERKIGVMFIILFISLFAVSFPSLSKQTSFLRIPGVLFFVGKHFGTGVILATAFIHLLDDAFRSLQDERVKAKYGRIGKWTGSIILVSLLSIFLVEYISTSYVQRLQEKPSAPPTPTSSRPISPTPNPQSHSRSGHEPQKTSSSRSRSRSVTAHGFPHRPSAEPPLIPELDSPPDISLARAPSAPILPVQARSRTYPHPQYHIHPSHHHHAHAPTIPASAVVGLPIEVLTNSPRICRLTLAHDYVHGHHCHVFKGDLDGNMQPGEGESAEEERRNHVHALEHEHKYEHHYPTIGRRRQVVGLLVLQLGIMIHSLVIGLTLSVTSGSDFTSLTTAIIFHQLFEGLSLGIRIAALPPNQKNIRNCEHAHTDDSVAGGLSHPSIPSPTVVSARRYNDVEEPSAASSTQHSQLGDNSSVHDTGTVNDSTRFTPHLTTVSPIFQKAPRISGRLFSYRRWMWKLKHFEWLKPTLTLLFGVTTPFGMVLGMAVWDRRASGDSGDKGSMLLIQGVMSAISAGMLIYAATVEMIAADFVFGDIEGNHHHHHHHHAHDPTTDEFHRREHDQHMDEESAGRVDIDGESRTSVEEVGKKKQPTAIRKQILAVLSLFAGAGMMVLVGLGE